MIRTLWLAATRTLRNALGELRGLRFGIAWQVAMLGLSLLAMPFDHRRILGLNPWLKPVKFELSILIFLVTVTLLLHAVIAAGRWQRLSRSLAWGFAVCMSAEITVIALQSLRGVPSHMNLSTTANALLFAVMGLMIGLNTILVAALLVLWCVTRLSLRPALVWAVRLGLCFQLAAAAEGVRIVMNAGHTVLPGASGRRFAALDAARDSDPGLPLVNWSMLHGDLRVAHFAALHALQLLPLVALVLIATRFKDRVQVTLVFAFAAAYAACTWWLFAEAMRGVPVIASR